jgi:hypothetical protein
MAFAVSWNPFVKSKNRAIATTSETIRIGSTRIFLLGFAGDGRPESLSAHR